MPEHFTYIVTGAAADASVFNTPLEQLNDAIVAEVAALEEADALLEHSYEAADDAIMVVIAEETQFREAAMGNERAERISADTNEEAERIAQDTAIQAQIERQLATTATSGGTATTQLTRNAGAADIASIGGDGTTTTVTSSGPHGFSDGDYLTISGTINYNGDSAAINVLSTTQFSYASAVNAATETIGSARTKRLFVASTTNVTVAQQLTVTSDQGQLHTTTVSDIPNSGEITMAAAVPSSWTLAARASVGGIVSSTLEEVRLMRTALASNGMLTAPDALKWSSGATISVRAMGGDPTAGVDNRQAIQNAIDAGGGSLTHKTIMIEAGDYEIGSTTGSGRLVNSLLIETDNTRLLFAPGARLVAKNGSHSRLIIVRNAQNVRFEGAGSIVYGRDDEAPQTALNIENSSNVVVDGPTFDGWTSYGVAITEDTSTAVFPSSGTSFDAASKQIRNVPGSFPGGPLGYQPGGKLTVVASLTNDGVYTIAAVAGDTSWVQVNETLVTEAAGATTPVIASRGVSFNVTDNTIVVDSGGLFRFPEGSQMLVAGSTSNNRTFTVVQLDYDGTSVKVAESVVNEPAGALVTIAKVARPNVNVQLATACNDITIRNCHFRHIAGLGIEQFPKQRSHNHTFINNSFYDCGYDGNGAAMKVGQATVNTIVAFNHIAHAVHGIQVVNWETIEVVNNIIHNGYGTGIPITESIHQKYAAEFRQLTVKHNQLAYVLDYESGTPFDPAAANTIDPTRRPRAAGSAINVNGLQAALNGTAPAQGWGTIEIESNTITDWAGGNLSSNKSLMPIPGIVWKNNTCRNSGSSLVVPLTFYAQVMAASAITTFKEIAAGPAPGAATTAGLYRGIPIIGDPTYIQPGTVISDMNPATGEVTLSKPAVGTGTIGVTTAYPEKMHVEGNTYEDTGTSYNKIVRVMSPGARLLRNAFIGLAPYALQIKGDAAILDNNYFERINGGPTHTVSRSAILLNERGSYTVTNTTVNVGGTDATGYLDYITAAGAIASTDGGLGGSVSFRSANNVCTLSSVQGQNGGIVLAVTQSNSGLRTAYGNAAPSSGPWLQGERYINIAPTALLHITDWDCVASGTPGTWRANGVGQGTAASRPTPGPRDAGYRYFKTDTHVMSYWDGAAWWDV